MEEQSLALSFSNSLTEEVSGITGEYVELGLDALVEDGLFKDIPIVSTAVAVYRIGKSIRERHHKLDPELRSTEEVDGKRRIREFYAMTPEDAYSILEAIAEINNYSHRLKKWKATANEQKDEALAQEINEQHQERMAPFTFSACGIKIGEQIEFFCIGNTLTGTLCEVIDDKHVSYNGETWSLTALAKHLLGTKKPLAGPRYFKYKGEWLNSIRHRLGE